MKVAPKIHSRGPGPIKDDTSHENILYTYGTLSRVHNEESDEKDANYNKPHFIILGDILDEVYQIIADMLTRVEWEKLLNSLQLSFKEKFVIFLSTRSTEVLKSRNLSWSGIRNRLQDLNRTDVLKVIRTKTCISAGEYKIIAEI